MTVERRTYVFYIKYFTSPTTPSSEALQLHLEKNKKISVFIIYSIMNK
jgi:hypothetical protein